MSQTPVTPTEPTNDEPTNDQGTVKPEVQGEVKPEFTPEQQAAKIAELTAEAERHRKKAAEYKKELDATGRTKSEEIESLQARLAEIEKERFDAKIEALKAKYNVSDEDAKEFFTDDLAYNEKIAPRLGKAADDVTPTFGNIVPAEGRQATPVVDEYAEASKHLFS